ncbi:hypothetical protein scyTo_0013315 [Scyliorhinus torazame]|uniref:SAC domain-containing protein n=1 Tax=Scyliorhinus torazame TaxID=75743 RepID=A0A401NTV9_SCYTO|nr:hypothetical protein [Scyliorhinus torazame]
MRYKRRGVDSDGNVANYVETEQLVYRGDNILSFVQLRGSVPIFWSQQGYRYKPRPKLHRNLMHGVKMTMDMQTLIGKEKPAKALLKRESMSRQKEEIEALIQTCSFLLIPTSEEFLGGWLFINCMPSSGDTSAQDVDVTFLLSNHACYFAYIDKDSEITHHSRIGLEDIDKIEIGKNVAFASVRLSLLELKIRQPIAMANSKTFHLRLHCRSAGKRDGLFTLQSTLQCQQDSSRGTLQSIAKAVQKAKRDTTGLDLPVLVDNPHRGLIEAAPDVPELPARFTPTIKVNAGPAECHEGEVLYQIDQQRAKDQMFSIYLPTEGKQTLPHPVKLLEKEDDSSDFWPYVSSSSSTCSTCKNSDQEEYFLSSNSTSSSSSFLSESDPTTMQRFMLAQVDPSAGRPKAGERSQAQRPPLAARFPCQNELPPIRGLGINTTSRYSRNLQAQGLPPRLKVPTRPSSKSGPRAGQAGRPATPKRPSAQPSPAQVYNRASPSKGQSRGNRRARHTARAEEARLASWSKQMDEILPPD